MDLSPNRIETDVIIIGAGPTGLMAACQLARLGIRSVIIDKKSGINHQSRALLVTARSREIYDQMGLSDSISENVSPVDNISVYLNKKKALQLNIGIRREAVSEFPCFSVLEQSVNESLLRAHLKNLGNDVLWMSELVRIDQQGDFICAEVVHSGEGAVVTEIRGAYLLGCDGANSTVRKLLGQDFPGGTYPRRFFVADVFINIEEGENMAIASPASYSFIAFFPMKGKNRYRVLGNIPDELSDKTFISEQELFKVIETNAPFPLKVSQMSWHSNYLLHHRCATDFQKGRCFLLGDAAHIHSPAGGQGMNTGLQDAFNLCWKLDLVIRAKASSRLLATYHSERYPVAQALLRSTDRVFNFLMSRKKVAVMCRSYLAPWISRLFLNNKRIEHRVFNVFSQTNICYDESPLSINSSGQRLNFKAGSKCPALWIYSGKTRTKIYDLLRVPGFHLFLVGSQPSAALKADCADLNINIHIADMSSQWETLGVQETLCLLIRPDHHVSVIADNERELALKSYFAAI